MKENAILTMHKGKRHSGCLFRILEFQSHKNEENVGEIFNNYTSLVFHILL